MAKFRFLLQRSRGRKTTQLESVFHRSRVSTSRLLNALFKTAFVLVTLSSAGGCITTAQTTEETKTASNYTHAKLYVDMPYESSASALEAWVTRCYPNGELITAIPLLYDKGLGYFVSAEDGLVRVQVRPTKTTLGLPNAFTIAGGILANAEFTADGNGTAVSVDAWRHAKEWASRFSKIILEHGQMSCWS